MLVILLSYEMEVAICDSLEVAIHVSVSKQLLIMFSGLSLRFQVARLIQQIGSKLNSYRDFF